MKPNRLPDVSKILGVHSPGAPSSKEVIVHLEYVDPSNQHHELRMPINDAMYLLGILREVQKRVGLQKPNDPKPEMPSDPLVKL